MVNILEVIMSFVSHLIFFSEVAPNERKRSSVPIFVQFPGAPGERSASTSSCGYVQLRAGKPNEGACMYKFTVEGPKLSIFVPDDNETAPLSWNDDLKIVCER